MLNDTWLFLSLSTLDSSPSHSSPNLTTLPLFVSKSSGLRRENRGRQAGQEVGMAVGQRFGPGDGRGGRTRSGRARPWLELAAKEGGEGKKETVAGWRVAVGR